MDQLHHLLNRKIPERKSVFCFVLFLTLLFPLVRLAAFSFRPDLPVYVYTDAYNYDDLQYYIASGWTGDVLSLLLDIEWTNRPQSGKSCMRFAYNSQVSNFFDWVGVVWQYPSCNWGEIDGGLDLSRASELSFYARGETGTERILFTVGGCYGVFSDTAQIKYGPVRLTREWKKYTIYLDNQDLTHISWGFGFFINKWPYNSNRPVVFYLDNIIIE